MEKVILQLWEESDIKHGVYADGCSIHLDISSRNEYVDSVYRGRKENYLPDVYRRVSCDATEVYITSYLYNKLIEDGYLILKIYELHNLIKMDEILC